MVDISSQEKKINIKIQSGGAQANVGVTQDTAQYYSEKSREWAISSRIVDGVDYSSKYYAEKSKEAEINVKEYESSIIEKYNSFVEISNQATDDLTAIKINSIEEIDATKETSLKQVNTEIENSKNLAIEKIQQETSTQISNIESTGFYMRDDKLYFINSKGEEEEFKSEDDNAANKDLSNLSEIGEKHFLGNSNITNCIRKKPQKFNLELTDGVLTLKSGSIVTVANRFETDETTPKFDEITVNADASSSSASASTKVLISYSTSSNVLIALPLANSTAGAGVTATNGLALDTTINKISSYNSSGSLQYSDCCLPLAIVSTDSSGKYTTIDQVFDGIGYIGTAGTTGSTIWVTKDITMIIPEDKNDEDGSYKNIVFTTTRTLLRNGVKGETRRSVSFYSTNAIGIGTGFMSAKTYVDRDSTFGYQYVEDLNKTFVSTRDYAEPLCIIADITCNANSITSFRPKNVFRALDINDKAEIASWGFPSNKYIDIVFGASGTTYIAPANGWFQCDVVSTTIPSTVELRNTVTWQRTNAIAVSANQGMFINLQAQKGAEIYLGYIGAKAYNQGLRFIYAEGEQ